MIHQLLIRYLSIIGSNDTSKKTVNSNPQTLLFHFKGGGCYERLVTNTVRQNGGQQKGLNTDENYLSLKIYIGIYIRFTF